MRLWSKPIKLKSNVTLLRTLPLLTCLIANLPCCTNHTVMAADREIRSDGLAGTWGTDATAHRRGNLTKRAD